MQRFLFSDIYRYLSEQKRIIYLVRFFLYNQIKKNIMKQQLTSMTRSRNAYKQMYERLKKELQEKDYFIEEFRIEIKDLEKDIDFYKASLESKDVQIKKMKKYINELEVDKENSRVLSLEYIKCYNSKRELEEELQQANKYKTYLHTCLVIFGMALILIGILCVK